MSKSINPKMDADEARQHLLKDFQNLSEEMEALMHNFFSDKRRFAPSPGHGFSPAMDVFETESEIVCLLDLVGVAPQDLNVRIEAGTLIISGVRREIPGFERRHYHKMELDFGAFERLLLLPEPIVVNSLRVENMGGFYLLRMRKIFAGLKPSASSAEAIEFDPRR